MSMIGEMTLEEAACMAADNWKSWSCFVWDREQVLDDAENWSIVYTHNRDSGLLACSNAEAIARALKPFAAGDDPDVVFESHSHWAVGHVDGFSIRVHLDGTITEAFRAYHGVSERLAEYPILDETDYAEKELEATLENITDAAWQLKDEYELHDGWESKVYSWLSDKRPGSLENRDDQGGYPSEDHLQDAFDVLGYRRVERHPTVQAESWYRRDPQWADGSTGRPTCYQRGKPG